MAPLFPAIKPQRDGARSQFHPAKSRRANTQNTQRPSLAAEIMAPGCVPLLFGIDRVCERNRVHSKINQKTIDLSVAGRKGDAHSLAPVNYARAAPAVHQWRAGSLTPNARERCQQKPREKRFHILLHAVKSDCSCRKCHSRLGESFSFSL